MSDLRTTCTELAQRLREVRAIAAPYDAQIQALEIARADATASLTFQIESLKAVIRPMVLAQRQSVKVDGMAAIFTQRQSWESETLLAMAQEIPAILQCQRDASYVTFR
jgi:hypothetical protein